MPEIFGLEGVNFYGKRGINAADPVNDKDVVNFRTLQWFLEKAEFSAITASGGSAFVQIGNQGGGVPVYYGLSGNTQIFNSFSAGTNLGIISGSAISYYLQPNISISGLTAQTITIPPFSANCNDIVTIDCDGNLTHSAGTTVIYSILSAGTGIEIISGTPKTTIRHTLWETGRTTPSGPYSTSNMAIQLQRGGNVSNGNFSLVTGRGNYNSGPYSSILGGSGHTITTPRSSIIGGKNITVSLSSDTTVVPYLRIANIYQGPHTPFQFLTIDSNGYVYKTGLTISSVSGLSFVNLDSAGAPNGNIYNFQNLGNVYMRSLTSGNYVALTQTANHINISLSGINSLYNYWVSGTGVSSIMSRKSGNTATNNYSFTQGHNNHSGGKYSVVFGHSNSAFTGSYSSIFNGLRNYAGTGLYTTVINGFQNTARTNFTTVLNGSNNNLKSGVFSTIINGKNNYLQSTYTIIGSGYFHTAKTNSSFGLILNGKRNLILDTSSSGYNLIGNGTNNQTEFIRATVINGDSNFARGVNTTIINGILNTARTGYSTIINGNSQYISSLYGFIGSGAHNSAQTTNPSYSFATVLNGRENKSGNKFSTIINGRYVISNGIYSFVGNGKNNSATTTSATVLNGMYNIANGLFSFIGNGKTNQSTAKYSFVGNGLSNSATSNYSIILNGRNGYIKGAFSTIINGWNNSASTTYFPLIGTGYGNIVNSKNSSVINGKFNIISDPTTSYSFIGGGIENIISSGLTSQTTNNLNLIGTGYNNKISGGTKSSIVNGTRNYTYSYSLSFIGNGNINRILNGGIGTGAETILNGNLNTAQTSFATILGGVRNQARGLYSLIGNGKDNTIVRNTSDSLGSITILNGAGNIISAETGSFISSFSQILNGSNQKITNAYKSSIIGGGLNIISGDNYSFIGAGSGNQLIKNSGFTTPTSYTTRRNAILGGATNKLYNAIYTTSLGGINNTGGGYANIMFGGKGNDIYKARIFASGGSQFSFIGGYGNYIKKGSISGVFSNASRIISGDNSFILGGGTNIISASTNSVIIGGANNLISGTSRAVILGGNGLILTDNSLSSTGNDSDHTYVSFLKIKNTPNGGTRFLTIDANGYIYSTGTTGGGGTGGSGTSGSSGANGTSGSSGTNGTSGSSGVNGTSGSSGSRGTSGSSGANGTSGSSGANGTSGSAGSSGVNGTSGSSGTSPVNGGGNLIVMNSSYVSGTTTSSSYYYGNDKSGWNGEPWDLTNSNFPIIINAFTDYNCGVPLPFDINAGEWIKVCGTAYHPAADASCSAITQISYITCEQMNSGTPTTQDLASNATVFNNNGTVCFVCEGEVLTTINSCSTFIYFGIGVSKELTGDFEFSYTITRYIRTL